MSEKEIFNADYKRLVAHLRTARERAGLSQLAVAAKLGKNRTWLAKIESCELRLDVLHLVKLCRVLGLQARQVIGMVEKAP